MQTKQKAPRRAGRPDAQTSEALDRHILDTATRLFIEQGYAATSIEQVALAAGSSKATIYRRYSCKEDLFASVSEDMVTVILEKAAAAERSGSDVSDPLAVLREACRALLDLAAEPDVIAVYRVLIAEAPRFPSLVDRVVQKVHAPKEALFLRLLCAAREAGQIRLDCPVDELFRALNGLTTGWVVHQNLLGHDSLTTEAERTAFFNVAWAVFLNGATYS